jgi:hypothetical protein
MAVDGVDTPAGGRRRQLLPDAVLWVGIAPSRARGAVLVVVGQDPGPHQLPLGARELRDELQRHTKRRLRLGAGVARPWHPITTNVIAVENLATRDRAQRFRQARDGGTCSSGRRRRSGRVAFHQEGDTARLRRRLAEEAGAATLAADEKR